MSEDFVYVRHLFMRTQRTSILVLLLIGIGLALYVFSYHRLRSNSYVFANRLNLGVSYEQLERGEDPTDTAWGRRKITIQGWFYYPCILVDERLDDMLIRIEFPSRPEKF